MNLSIPRAMMLAGLGLAAAGTALAANPVTTTFQVTATVLKACTVSATPLAFGNYTPGSGAITNTSTINVACTKSSPYSVTLNGGSTTGGTIAQRLMTNGSQTLQYNLYTSNAYTTLLGDGTTGAKVTATGAGLTVPNPITVYGQLPDTVANQSVPAGSYTDTITVSVSY
jgi:spore coat protein U-like protein